MQRILSIPLFIALFLGNAIAPAAQPQPEKGHQHVILYGFTHVLIASANEYARDTALTLVPAYLSAPYAPRKVHVYGPTLVGVVSRTGFSLGMNLIALIGTTSLTTAIDTSRNNNAVTWENLEVRVLKNRAIYANWRTIDALPPTEPAPGQSRSSSPHYFIKDSLSIGDEVVAEFRHRANKIILFRIEYLRKSTPLRPFQVRSTHDSSSAVTVPDFVAKNRATMTKDFDQIDKFYRYWPARETKEPREQLFPNSKIALLFRHPDPQYKDTTLQYSLLRNNNTDTVWSTTGHLLFIHSLSAGSDYTLLLRYKSNPSAIYKKMYYTARAWYQESRYKWIGVGIVLASLFLFLLIYGLRLRKEKRKSSQLDAGLSSIRSQLNPHFVFNALASIQSLINKNDIAGANHYLSKFSSLLRDAMRSNEKEMSPLDVELKILRTYLEVEALRFPFSYEIVVSEQIDRNAIEIPSLLLQPLVENAVKHGISSIQGSPGIVSINIAAHHNDLLATVIDNGCGFDVTGAHQGLGLKLTTDRIALLNRHLRGQKIEMRINSSETSGTTVHLRFKNWL